MAKEKKGMMFVLSSPSGTGKTTLTKKLAENNKNFAISISHTTRKPRPNEINGKDYYFVSKKEFKDLLKENNFFEYANIFDNWYATLKKPVLELLSRGKDVLFDIDWQGTKQLNKIKNLSLITFFILPPNLKALKELNFKVIAAGDSYNDTGMLQEADAGILFCPPENVIKEFPQFPVSQNYEEFKNIILKIRTTLNK